MLSKLSTVDTPLAVPGKKDEEPSQGGHRRLLGVGETIALGQGGAAFAVARGRSALKETNSYYIVFKSRCASKIVFRLRDVLILVGKACQEYQDATEEYPLAASVLALWDKHLTQDAAVDPSRRNLVSDLLQNYRV